MQQNVTKVTCSKTQLKKHAAKRNLSIMQQNLPPPPLPPPPPPPPTTVLATENQSKLKPLTGFNISDACNLGNEGNA